MKVVVAFVATLAFAVCSFVSAADQQVNKSNQPNTPSKVNTWKHSNPSNHANTTKNAKKWNKANTTNNPNTTNVVNVTNDPNTNNNPNTNNPNTTNVTTTNNNTNTNNPNTTNVTKSWNYAATPNNVNTTNNSFSSTQQLFKVSQEGFAALRAVRAARVAIFNGQPTVATEMLNKAKTNLDTASKDLPMFVANAEVTVNGKVVADELEVGKANWIPIDGQVSLTDTYVMSPEKTVHIQKANQYFKNGQGKEAIEELHLAEIDVNCTRVLMPLASTTNYVVEATKLVGEQKYYEANLLLKAVEDGLVVNSATLVEMPQVKTQNNKTTN